MEILEILKYILPSIVVLLTAWLTISSFLKNEIKKKQTEINIASKEIIIPIRLQAYERIILFLERISPGSLIMRIHQSGMSAYQLQTALLNNIREEFEHNLSQQLYISSNSWSLVKNAKEEIVKLINTASARLNDMQAANGDELSSKIFEIALQMENINTTIAIENIKKEIRHLFKF